MTTVLFIHSAGSQGPGEGSSALLASLKAALPAPLSLEAPLMPKPDRPEAGPWIHACQKAIAGVGDDLVLVGHSLGGSTLLQALARSALPERLKGVVTLAAPFWGAPDSQFDSFAVTKAEAGRLGGLKRLILLQGEDDEVVAADHPDRYRALLPQAEIRRLKGVDHEAADAGAPLAAAIAAVTA
jgi:predicted alpha/beta hydrolase family esterase